MISQWLADGSRIEPYYTSGAGARRSRKPGHSLELSVLLLVQVIELRLEGWQIWGRVEHLDIVQKCCAHSAESG